MNTWRYRRPLNDDELLAAAEEAVFELANLPIDNETITDEEPSDEEDEDFETNDMTMILHEENLDNENVSCELEVNTGMEYNTPNAAPQFSESKKSKRGSRVEEEQKRKWKKKEISTNMPSYSLDENPIEEHFYHCSTYTDYFLTVLGPNTVKDIVYQSNLYATQRGKIMNFKECELLGFLGLNFFMGYHTLPSYTHYWSCAEDLGIPIVKRVMPRSRFEQFLQYLHINDNSTIPLNNKDKIYKIRPFVTTLNERFDILNNGTRKLSVDESMIIFKGRSTLKQYNPKKPIKRGYKLWCLGDQNGYIKKFDVYQGKNEVAEKKFQDFGLGERVVLTLTENYWGTNRIIYFDNYFTSVFLLEKLKTEKTLACGTVQRDRLGLPSNKMKEDKTFRRGDIDYRISNMDISFFKWCDNRIVHFLSNFHGTELTTVKRQQKDGTKIDINCGQVVDDYNKHMGGVDQADRLRQAYCINRRSKKWWHRLFFGIVDIAFVNSYILYKKLNPEEHLTLLDFRRGVALGLMNQTNNSITNKKRGSTASANPRNSPQNSLVCTKRRKYTYSVSDDVRLSNRGVHWPIFTPKRGRCEQCSSIAIESRPYSKCSNCSVYLCVNDKKNCFTKYHNIAESSSS